MCILARIGIETTTSSNTYQHLGMDNMNKTYGATDKAVSRASLHEQHRHVSEYQTLADAGGGLRLPCLGDDGIAPCNPYNLPTGGTRVACGAYLCSYRLFPPLRLVSCCLIHQQYHLGQAG